MEIKITHVDWINVEEKVGNLLQEHQVCSLLGISKDVLIDYLNQGILRKEIDFQKKTSGFNIVDVKCFAEKYLGIKDGSYIHDEAKDQEHKDQDSEDFFTSICNTVTQRIADAKEIAEKNGSQCGLSYLVGCFDITNNSIRNYIQTLQEGGGR